MRDIDVSLTDWLILKIISQFDLQHMTFVTHESNNVSFEGLLTDWHWKLSVSFTSQHIDITHENSNMNSEGHDIHLMPGLTLVTNVILYLSCVKIKGKIDKLLLKLTTANGLILLKIIQENDISCFACNEIKM